MHAIIPVVFVVFMSPEIAVVPPWRKIFKTPCFHENLCLVAIDEAHCIAEWYVANYLTVFAVVSHIMCDCVNLCPGEVTSERHSPRLVGYEH